MARTMKLTDEQSAEILRRSAMAAGAELFDIPLGDLIPTPDNTRRMPTAGEIAELAENIKEDNIEAKKERKNARKVAKNAR
jgi:hypothetical protein